MANTRTCILEFLLQVGQIREKDFHQFIGAYYSSESGKSNCIKSLKADGMVEIKEYRIRKNANHRSGIDRVYVITNAGIDYIFDHRNSVYLRTNLHKFGKEFNIRSRESIPEETDRVDRLLTDVGIKAFFSAAGRPVLPWEKPSLIYLATIFSYGQAETTDGYPDTISKEKCKELLEKGIYYSIDEYMDFVKRYAGDLTDTIIGTRARGVFISNKSCYFVYASWRYNNKILRVNIKGERGLVKSSELLYSWTKIDRAVPFLDTFEHHMYYNERIFYHNKAHAIIISDGDMLAYATATGHAKGKYDEENQETISEKQRKMYDKILSKKDSKHSTFLTSNSDFYERIFVIPHNKYGLDSLSYILRSPVELWYENACTIMDERPYTFVKQENPAGYFPYLARNPYDSEQFCRVVYIPAFEAKEIRNLSSAKGMPCIITYRDMLDKIARGIGRDAIYYDDEKGCFFPQDCVYIYDKSGDIAGEHMIYNYLKSIGLTFDRSKAESFLKKEYSINPIVYYNAVARGKISVEEASTKLITKEYIPHNKYKSKYKGKSFALSREMSKSLEALAKEKGWSTSRLVREMMKAQLHKETDV